VRALRIILIFGVALLGLCLTTGLAHLAGWKSLRPDPVLPIVIYLALRRSLLAGGWQALLLGYLVDLFSAAPPGLHAVAYVSTLTLIRLVSILLEFRLVLAQVAAGAAAVIVERATVLLLLSVFGGAGSGLLWVDVARWPLLALAGALITPVYYEILRRIDRLVPPRPAAQAQGLPRAARALTTGRVTLPEVPRWDDKGR